MRVSRAVIAALAVGLVAGWSCGSDEDNNAAPVVANVRLTKAQRAHIQLYTVAPVGYRQRVPAPGTVDYDNNQATAVLSPPPDVDFVCTVRVVVPEERRRRNPTTPTAPTSKTAVEVFITSAPSCCEQP